MSEAQPPRRRRIDISLPSGSGYPVVVGPGVRDEMPTFLPSGCGRVAVVTQPGIGLEPAVDLPVSIHEIGRGEAHKRMATVERLCSEWSNAGLSRADCVVAVGGGMVTDVAGFAASVYHRGIPVLHVATSLLAQIDAAIGGKTGVNLPEGKNLVGTFWQPAAVLCDTDALETLPPAEWRCGLGELAKYHWLGAGALDELGLVDRVAECVSTKARFVTADEREGGRRALLNYGHTLAHALETVGGHELRHGEAVAIGLVYAAELARAMSRVGDEVVAEHRRVVQGYGLPCSLPPGMDHQRILDAMGRDKKSLGSGLTFVLDGAPPDSDGVTVEVVRDVERGVALQALALMA